VKRREAAYWMLSHFKRKTTKKWKIEKYCKNPLVYPLKITLLIRRGGELGDGSTEMKKQSMSSFHFFALNRNVHCSNVL
jgi:hypothetical protein